jgi:hypothetical protein
MKLKALALALFLAGAGSSYALAGNGHGGGHGHARHADSTSTSTDDSTTEATTTTAAHGKKPVKVTICHRAGKSGRWVKLKIAPKAAAKRLKKGDQPADADGKCPAPTPKTHTGTDETTTEASK